MIHHKPPLHNPFWPPYRQIQPCQSHISYPNYIPIRRSVFNRIWRGPNFSVQPYEGARRTADQDVSDSKSTGPPPGFEFRRYAQKIFKEKGGSTTSRASNTIHISNVAISMKNEEIRKICEVYGQVERISYLKSYRFPKSMVCFVRYKTEAQTEIAKNRLGGTRRHGKVWKVSRARKDLQPLESERKSEEDDGRVLRQEESNKAVDLIVGEENKEIVQIMDKSWMLVSEKPKPTKEIREILDKHGLLSVSLIKWGLYGEIAVCKDEGNMVDWNCKMVELEKHFIKVEKIDAKEKRHMRYCWIEVKGIPIQAWSIESMVNIAKRWGNLLALDIETDMAYRVDVAKLFIEIRGIEKIEETIEFYFQNELFKIIIQEVEREEDMEVKLSQQSSLGKQPCADSTTGTRAFDYMEGLGLGSEENYGVSKERETRGSLQGKDMVEVENTENGKDDSFTKKEGFGDTQVAETPPIHVTFQERTPIFKPKSIECRKGREEKVSKGVKYSKLGGEDIEIPDCTCCSKFHKRKGDGGKTVELEKYTERKDNQDKAETSKVSVKRKGGRSKRKTPKKKSQAITRKGLFIKETKITKQKGRKGRKNQKKDKEDSYGLKDSTSNSLEIVNEGLDLCEEVGLKIKCNSAKRLQFEKFMLETNEGEVHQVGGIRSM